MAQKTKYLQLNFFLTENSVRPIRTKHSPVLFTVTAAVFSKRHMTPCAYSSYYLNVQPDTWNTTISVMSNVNARHYTNISLRRDETEQIPSLLTVQTLSQFPHSETPELASLFLALSTVEISTPVPRATVADSQFQQDSSIDTFHLLFQCALTNKRLNHEASPLPPHSQQLAPKNTTLTSCLCACDTWCVSLMSTLWYNRGIRKEVLGIKRQGLPE